MKNKFKIKAIHFVLLLPIPILTLLENIFKRNIYVILSFVIFTLAFLCYFNYHIQKKKEFVINKDSARKEIYILFSLIFISIALKHFINYLFSEFSF